MTKISKLHFKFWYIAMHLMVATKKNIAALEMKRQIGHAFYEPIWAMMHKLRRAMANRDEKHQLSGEIELDEAFFVVNDHRDPDAPSNVVQVRNARQNSW
ncbi:MAG TPA: IS1595 family transposase [Bacteroidia bacterium]|nr:IS1595 family transposase [Bacteroidia bacterium]